MNAFRRWLSSTSDRSSQSTPPAMTSTLKSKIADAAGSRNSVDDDSTVQQEADKYRLLVTAGPSYDPATHEVVRVNTSTSTTVDNEFLRAKIRVRIRGFRGLPAESPSSSPYFDDPVHTKDQYSVAFSFVPKRDLPSVDTIWGNDFDHPVRDRLPPGFNTAFRIVKVFIDPGLECDAYADEPWLYGPSLSCWFGFRIGDKLGQEDEIPERAEGEHVLREGADGEGQSIRDRLGLPENNEKRRKFFLSKENREGFVFEKDRLYSGDFYNPYLDFGNFALKLPGFSIKVIKYIDEKSHCLRYVFKNRRTEEVYFCINFHLLWGEQLQKALKEDGGLINSLAGMETEMGQKPQSSAASNTDGDATPNGQSTANDPETNAHAPSLSPPESKENGNRSPSTSSQIDRESEKETPEDSMRKLSITDQLQDTSSHDRRESKTGMF